MATLNGILLALTGLALALQAMAATAGTGDAEALDGLAREIARRRRASRTSKA